MHWNVFLSVQSTMNQHRCKCSMYSPPSSYLKQVLPSLPTHMRHSASMCKTLHSQQTGPCWFTSFSVICMWKFTQWLYPRPWVPEVCRLNFSSDMRYVSYGMNCVKCAIDFSQQKVRIEWFVWTCSSWFSRACNANITLLVTPLYKGNIDCDMLEHLEHMIVSIIMGASATGISEGTLNTIILTAWYVKILFRTNSTVLSVFCRWFVYDYHYLNLVSIYSLRHFRVVRINIGY